MESLQELRNRNRSAGQSAPMASRPSLSDLRRNVSSGSNKAVKPSTTSDSKGALQETASPFLKFGSSLLGIVQGAGNLGAAGLAELFGNEDQAKKFIRQANDALSKQRNFGAVGSSRPLGIDENGKQMGAVDYTKDIVSTGTQLAPYVIGGGAVSTAGKTGLAALRASAGAGLTTGAVGGALTGFGSALSKKDASVGSVLGETVKGSVVGAAAGAILNPIVEVAFPSVARAINKSTLRLTPSQKANIASKAEDAASFLTERGIVGTPQSRYSQITNLFDESEKAVQSAFNGAAEKGVTAPRSEVISELEKIPARYQFDRDAEQVARQVQDAISTLKKNFPEDIPIDKLNIFKRSTMSGAYNEAGNKVLSPVEHDIGDSVYSVLSRIADENGVMVDGMPLRQFNAGYSRIINARKLLKTAVGRSQVGALSKLLFSLAGASIFGGTGGNVGAAFGAVAAPSIAEQAGGTFVRSTAARGLSELSKRNMLPTAATQLITNYSSNNTK